MAKFRIMPHSRLQEWVAEEKGYFTDEGLDYEFIRGRQLSAQPTVTLHGPSARRGKAGRL